jgi:hypothetical protein
MVEEWNKRSQLSATSPLPLSLGKERELKGEVCVRSKKLRYKSLKGCDAETSSA